MSKTIRAAAVQMDVYIGENDRNLQRVLEKLEEAAKNGAQLVVFPECALSGYCFASLEEARPHAGVGFLKELIDVRTRLGVDVTVLGFLEEIDNDCYNSAFVFTRPTPPTNFVFGSYRKTHLPTLG